MLLSTPYLATADDRGNATDSATEQAVSDLLDTAQALAEHPITEAETPKPP